MRNENGSGAIGNGDNREGNRRKFTGESCRERVGRYSRIVMLWML